MDTETPYTRRVMCNMWVVSRIGPLASLFYLQKHRTWFMTKWNTLIRRNAYRR